MKYDELEELLKVLLQEDITDVRRLEIFDTIRQDKKNSIDENSKLSDNLLKITTSYEELRKKTIDDFFNHGEETETPSTEPQTQEETQVTYEDIIVPEEEM